MVKYNIAFVFRVHRTLENLEISWDEKDDLENLGFFSFSYISTILRKLWCFKMQLPGVEKKKIFQAVDLGIITALLLTKITWDLPNL